MCRASVRAVAALLLAASSSNAYTQRLTAPQSSTDTRVVWPGPEGQTMFESMDEVHRNMTEYLWKNIQPYDIPRAQTLGFRENSVARVSSPDWPRAVGSDAALQTDAGPKEQPCVDGLADGILNQTLHYAIQAKLKYPWSDRIPKDIYLEYVLPFSVVNEPRTDHRTLLSDTDGSPKGLRESRCHRENEPRESTGTDQGCCQENQYGPLVEVGQHGQANRLQGWTDSTDLRSSLSHCLRLLQLHWTRHTADLGAPRGGHPMQDGRNACLERR